MAARSRTKEKGAWVLLTVALMTAAVIAVAGSRGTAQVRSATQAHQPRDFPHLHAMQTSLITCTLSTTTTDALPGINSFDDAAILANYSGLALASGNKGDQVNPEEDYFRLDNATLHWSYAVQAVPDGVGNYNLAMIIYDSNRHPILTDTNPFDGNSASLTLVAENSGPYYFKIFQYSDQCSGGTYHLSVSATAPTPTPTPTSTPTPTPTPGPGTPTPTPTWISGYDQYEPNYDFDHAKIIAPGVTYDLNFVPWGNGDVDNDYFKLWVKPGLIFTCETFDLAPVVDTNMIFYDANRNLIGGNDDRTLGDYSSKLSYYSTYEGYLYILIGPGQRLSREDSAHSDYRLRCTKSVPGTVTGTPVPSKDEATPIPTPTAKPNPTTSPLPTPTSAAQSSVELTIQPMTTPAPSTPTAEASGFRTFRVTLYYDTNNDGQFGAGEGVSGIFIRITDFINGEELARGYTNEEGQLTFTVPTVGTVFVEVPLLGLSRPLEPERPEMQIRIAPMPLPDQIP